MIKHMARGGTEILRGSSPRLNSAAAHLPPDSGRANTCSTIFACRAAARENGSLLVLILWLISRPGIPTCMYGCVYNESEIVKHARLICTYRMSARMSDYLYTHLVDPGKRR